MKEAQDLFLLRHMMQLVAPCCRKIRPAHIPRLIRRLWTWLAMHFSAECAPTCRTQRVTFPREFIRFRLSSLQLASLVYDARCLQGICPEFTHAGYLLCNSFRMGAAGRAPLAHSLSDTIRRLSHGPKHSRQLTKTTQCKYLSKRLR